MKQFYGAIALLVLVGFTTTVQAAQCRQSSGHAWREVAAGGAISLDVRVNVRLEVNSPYILLEGGFVECRFTPSGFPSREDYWATAASAWTPGPKFSSQGNGLRIHGNYYNSPVREGIWLATMPDNQTAYPLNVTPYILVNNSPTNPVNVVAGDALGTLTLDQTNNYGVAGSRLTIRYTANNNFSVSPSTCTINNNNPIVIDFGNVDQRAIGTDPLTTTVRSDRRLTYNCPTPGQSLPITITYQGTASSFNSNLLSMTNSDVGTALVRGGAAVRVGGSFLTRITNSVGHDDVTFSLVRRAGVFPDAGPISGSGVLVMGVP